MKKLVWLFPAPTVILLYKNEFPVKAAVTEVLPSHRLFFTSTRHRSCYYCIQKQGMNRRIRIHGGSKYERGYPKIVIKPETPERLITFLPGGQV